MAVGNHQHSIFLMIRLLVSIDQQCHVVHTVCKKLITVSNIYSPWTVITRTITYHYHDSSSLMSVICIEHAWCVSCQGTHFLRNTAVSSWAIAGHSPLPPTTSRLWRGLEVYTGNFVKTRLFFGSMTRSYKEQLKKGIVQIVEPEEQDSQKLHYFSHYPLVRQD